MTPRDAAATRAAASALTSAVRACADARGNVSTSPPPLVAPLTRRDNLYPPPRVIERAAARAAVIYQRVSLIAPKEK